VARTLSAEVLAGVNRELRKAKRYPLRVPVTFCWEDEGGILQEAQGTTLDISDRGLFVISDLLPQVGTHLEVDVYLPSVRGEPKSVRLRGEGKVVRATKKGPESGFGAEVALQTEISGGSVFGTGGLIN